MAKSIAPNQIKGGLRGSPFFMRYAYGGANMAYCKPWNAGLASETSAVCKRLSRLLDALHNEVNQNIAEGAICDDLREFSFSLQTKLEAEGWTFSYDGGDKLKVREPGHKKPFKKRIAA